MTFDIRLGWPYRDLVTEVTGIAISIARNLDGTTTVYLQPPIGSDGRERNALWFDHRRLVLQTDQKAIVIEGVTDADS